MNLRENIRQKALERGFNACRFTTAAPPESASHFMDWLANGNHGNMTWLERQTDKRRDPNRILAGAKTIITVAVSYAESLSFLQGAEMSQTLSASSKFPDAPSGIVARFARYQDYHEVMLQRLQQLADCIDALDPSLPRSLAYVDTGPLLERDLAQRAGLGFIGKHNNLISRDLGNWILLGEIITAAEFLPDSPERNRCGTCHRCMDACPTQAITAPFQLDSRRCISYLTIEFKGSIPVEFRPLLGSRIFGCDDCLSACPWNKFAQESRLMASSYRADLAAPGLLVLLALDDAGFKSRFVHTPIARSKRRGLLRNVCIALGNVGTMDAVPALERAQHDPEPLIAEHAQWAIGEIHRRHAVLQPKIKN